jgi:hypothetical protein
MENCVKEMFVDGISHINFLNGMIRITYGTLVPDPENENAEPTFVDTQRLVMPLNSFLAAFQSQKQLIDQLEEKGVITPKPVEADAPAGNVMEPIIPSVN